MFDHIGLKVSNLEASTRFYRAAMNPLGSRLDSSGDGYAGFGPEGQPALWLYAHPGPISVATHVAFRAANRAAVTRPYRCAACKAVHDVGPGSKWPQIAALQAAGCPACGGVIFRPMPLVAR